MLKTTPSLLAAFGVGAVTGYCITKGLSNLRPLSSERALREVKASLKDILDVDGAWIHLQPEEWENGKLTQTVYHGGVTETRDGEAVHYDFVVDAQTGTILKLEEQ